MGWEDLSGDKLFIVLLLVTALVLPGATYQYLYPNEVSNKAFLEKSEAGWFVLSSAIYSFPAFLIALLGASVLLQWSDFANSYLKQSPKDFKEEEERLNRRARAAIAFSSLSAIGGFYTGLFMKWRNPSLTITAIYTTELLMIISLTLIFLMQSNDILLKELLRKKRPMKDRLLFLRKQKLLLYFFLGLFIGIWASSPWI